MSVELSIRLASATPYCACRSAWNTDELIADLDHALAHAQPSNHRRIQCQSMTLSTW